MALLQELSDFDPDKEIDSAKKALFSMIGNLQSRPGFAEVWEKTDDDTKEELLFTNLRLIRHSFKLE